MVTYACHDKSINQGEHCYQKNPKPTVVPIFEPTDEPNPRLGYRWIRSVPCALPIGVGGGGRATADPPAPSVPGHQRGRRGLRRRRSNQGPACLVTGDGGGGGAATLEEKSSVVAITEGGRWREWEGGAVAAGGEKVELGATVEEKVEWDVKEWRGHLEEISQKTH